MTTKDQIITGILRNVPGVMMQIGESFKKLGLNIQCLNAAPTDDEEWSHITIVIDGHEIPFDNILAELRQHGVEVDQLREMGRGDIFERELALAKVRLNVGQTARIMQIAEVFQAHVLDLTEDLVTFEIAGTPERVVSFIRAVRPFTIVNIARTGRTAIPR